MNRVNIHKILSAFDFFVYSKIDENRLDTVITSDIKLDDLYKYIQETKETFPLKDTLEYYSLFYYSDRKRYIIKLVYFYKIENGILTIMHNPFVIMKLIHGVGIKNPYIQKILLSTTLSNNSLEYYSLLSRQGEHYYELALLKRYFNQKCQNGQFKFYKIVPFQEEIERLYDLGIIPYRITITPVRKTTSPPVYIGFRIKREDYIFKVYIARKRAEYLQDIMSKFVHIFTSEISVFYLNNINQLSDLEVYQLNQMVNHIDEDPDFNRISTFSLLMIKIAKKFNIVLPVELRQAK